MPDLILDPPGFDQYVLNYCTKYLARNNTDPRHNYNNQFATDDPRARIAENWRFPIINAYRDEADIPGSYNLNEVTFVYAASAANPAPDVRVIGTFANLYDPLPLRQIRFVDEPTRYFALSVKVPKGQVHTYRFVVDGQAIVDPINPQVVTLDNGQTWSRFFTQLGTIPLSFEAWEWVLLERLTSHILPFRTEEGQRFLEPFYFKLDRQTKEREYRRVYRLDHEVGVVNFIDNLVAKEERHHLVDYKICLSIINQVLRQRRPGEEPADMPRDVYADLYNEMAAGSVPGWDYSRYQNPRYFLQVLRRHSFTGAFSHPKYGGNVAAAGWAFLEERFRDNQGKTLFDWRQALEPPLGTNATYRG